MKLGLVCNNTIRKEVEKKIESMGINLHQNADIYIVEEGLHHNFNPCIVFNSNQLDPLFTFLQLFENRSSATKIIGMRDDSYFVMDHDSILFFEAVGASVYCHTKTDQFTVKEKLYQLEERLPKDMYLRVSRSYIININHVNQIIPWFNRRLLLKFDDTKKDVEVSKNYVKQLKDFLGMR